MSSSSDARSTDAPTLSQLHRPPGWLWLCCAGMVRYVRGDGQEAWRPCMHEVPMAIAPLVIRWGPDASSDRLRAVARCSRCGHRGATLRHPSWHDMQVGWQEWPMSEGR